MERVTATPAALAALARLREQRGPVILYQSGGCCDGSLPVCLEQGELRIGGGDVLLGQVGECPVYIDDRQYAAWRHTQLIIDVGEGEPEGFSLSAGDGIQFVTRSRPAATAPAASAPVSSSGAPGQTKTNIRVGGMVHGTKAICAALEQNPKLDDLVGVPSPSTLLYASGTVTNNVFGLNNVPGCQVGIDPTPTHAVVAWGLCSYPDPQGLSDNGPIWGTSNVYTLSGAANGVFIVLGQTTSVAMMEGTAGSSSESVVLPAIRDAAAIFQANGGCASS